MHRTLFDTSIEYGNRVPVNERFGLKQASFAEEVLAQASQQSDRFLEAAVVRLTLTFDVFVHGIQRTR